MQPIIEVNSVYKSFNSVHAVRGINLNIKRGQFTALLGPNGAGKTTLVEMIEGIQQPDRGSITIMGKKWKGNEAELHRHIGLSLQETHFIDRLTVQETLALFASFYDLDHHRIEEILGTINLIEKKNAYVLNLSGGQKQRLALGIALLNHPPILLLDEPTTGLDPNARRDIWDILLKLKASAQTSLILTTHYMEEAERLCDYIIIIDQGTILAEGPLEQLLHDLDTPRIIEFLVENQPDTIRQLEKEAPFDIQWGPYMEKGSFTITDLETDIPNFLKYLKKGGIRLKNLECRHKTLDDLFTSMTGRRLHE